MGFVLLFFFSRGVGVVCGFAVLASASVTIGLGRADAPDPAEAVLDLRAGNTARLPWFGGVTPGPAESSPES